MTAEHPASPRIFKVTYRGPRRVAKTFVKVPYSGIFAMNEALSRAMTTGQVLWFRVDVAKPGEITPEVRNGLERWYPALEHTSHITGVRWDA